MATNLLHFRPSVVQSCAIPNPKSDHARRKSSSSSSSSSSANWWRPLFGWSSEPDYINADGGAVLPEKFNGGGSESKPARSSRFSPGCFTEEKAKRLRVLTKGTTSFHDVMYHSAIASRLASDFKNGSDL